MLMFVGNHGISHGFLLCRPRTSPRLTQRLWKIPWLHQRARVLSQGQFHGHTYCNGLHHGTHHIMNHGWVYCVSRELLVVSPCNVEHRALLAFPRSQFAPLFVDLPVHLFQSYFPVLFLHMSRHRRSGSRSCGEASWIAYIRLDLSKLPTPHEKV